MKRFTLPSLLRRRRERHAARTREESRRFATRVSTVIIASGAIAGLIVAANRWLGRAEFAGFELRGRSVLDSAEVTAGCRVALGTPLAAISLDEIEGKVGLHPYIASASVYRGENSRLVIEIAERAPVAAATLNGAVVYLDSAGVVLPARFSSAALDLPFVSGVVSGSGGRNERVDTVGLREALAVLRSVRVSETGVYREISEVRREKNGEYSFLLTDNGITVQMGRPDMIDRRLDKLARALRGLVHDAGRPRSIATLDLRWHGQIVVKG